MTRLGQKEMRPKRCLPLRVQLTKGLARIRDGVVKVVLVNEQDTQPCLAQLDGLLDLAAVAGICPAWVAVSAND